MRTHHKANNGEFRNQVLPICHRISTNTERQAEEMSEGGNDVHVRLERSLKASDNMDLTSPNNLQDLQRQSNCCQCNTRAENVVELPNQLIPKAFDFTRESNIDSSSNKKTSASWHRNSCHTSVTSCITSMRNETFPRDVSFTRHVHHDALILDALARVSQIVIPWTIIALMFMRKCSQCVTANKSAAGGMTYASTFCSGLVTLSLICCVKATTNVTSTSSVNATASESLTLTGLSSSQTISPTNSTAKATTAKATTSLSTAIVDNLSSSSAKPFSTEVVTSPSQVSFTDTSSFTIGNTTISTSVWNAATSTPLRNQSQVTDALEPGMSISTVMVSSTTLRAQNNIPLSSSPFTISSVNVTSVEVLGSSSTSEGYTQLPSSSQYHVSSNTSKHSTALLSKTPTNSSATIALSTSPQSTPSKMSNTFTILLHETSTSSVNVTESESSPVTLTGFSSSQTISPTNSTISAASQSMASANTTSVANKSSSVLTTLTQPSPSSNMTFTTAKSTQSLFIFKNLSSSSLKPFSTEVVTSPSQVSSFPFTISSVNVTSVEVLGSSSISGGYTQLPSSSQYHVSSNTSVQAINSHSQLSTTEVAQVPTTSSLSQHENISESSMLIVPTQTTRISIVSTTITINSTWSNSSSESPQTTTLTHTNRSTGFLTPSMSMTASAVNNSMVLGSATFSPSMVVVTPSPTVELNGSSSQVISNQISSPGLATQASTSRIEMNTSSVQNISLSPTLEVVYTSINASSKNNINYTTATAVESRFSLSTASANASINISESSVFSVTSTMNVTRSLNISITPIFVSTSQNINSSSTLSINATIITSALPSTFWGSSSQVTPTSGNLSSIVLNLTTAGNWTSTSAFTLTITPSLNFTSTMNASKNHSVMTSSVTPISTMMVINASSSIRVPSPPTTNEPIRTIAIKVKILNESFQEGLLSNKTLEYLTLSQRVIHAFTDIFSSQPGFININNIKFSQGSVIVDFQANFNVTSNITALDVKAEILAHNGSKNTQNFTFQDGPEVYEILPSSVLATQVSTSRIEMNASSVQNISLSPTLEVVYPSINVSSTNNINYTSVTSAVESRFSTIITSVLPSTFWGSSSQVISTSGNLSSIFLNSTTAGNWTSTSAFTLTITPSLNSTSTMNASKNHSVMTSTVKPSSTMMVINASSSVRDPSRPTTNEPIRTIAIKVKILNEIFHNDYSTRNTSRYQNLSSRVINAYTDIFSSQPGFINITNVEFSNGSVIVDFQANFNVTSNITALDVKAEIVAHNGSRNTENFILKGEPEVYENCTTNYCFNGGRCQQNSTTGPFCECTAGFIGSRCDKVIVNGNYSNWSVFGECSKSCKGGTMRRTRTCTYPPPRYGGSGCNSLGPSYEDEDCNADVICPIIWIIIALCCVIFLLLILLLVICFIRRKKKEKERSSTHSNAGRKMNIIPLEIMVYDDQIPPRFSPDGHSNPEFINKHETEEDDIYKTQLLLFLKQSHLIKPGMNLSYGDDKSDTSDYTNKNSRKTSAMSSASGMARDEDSD